MIFQNCSPNQNKFLFCTKTSILTNSSVRVLNMANFYKIFFLKNNKVSKLALKMPYLGKKPYFQAKNQKTITIFDISSLELVKKQGFVQNKTKKFKFWTKNTYFIKHLSTTASDNVYQFQCQFFFLKLYGNTRMKILEHFKIRRRGIFWASFSDSLMIIKQDRGNLIESPLQLAQLFN